MALRTDMAAEKRTANPVKIDKDITRTDIYDGDGNVYITFESDMVKRGESDKYRALVKCISGALNELSGKKRKNIMIAGLGNPNLTADSLGAATVKRLIVTRHISGHIANLPSLSAVLPNVLGVTGIESFDVIKGVADRVKPDLVIAVDSLASATVGRIASAFQICGGGITPGSGVSNHRMRLSRETLGADVISIGVPLVVYATTIIEEASGKYDEIYDDAISSLIVTPKEIDLMVGECAKIIASSVNLTYLGEEGLL